MPYRVTITKDGATLGVGHFVSLGAAQAFISRMFNACVPEDFVGFLGFRAEIADDDGGILYVGETDGVSLTLVNPASWTITSVSGEYADRFTLVKRGGKGDEE